MNPAAHLLAPLALLLPSALAAGVAQGIPAESQGVQQGAAAAFPSGPVSHPFAGAGAPFSAVEEAFRIPDVEQVRIEQQVTIRISPRPAPVPLMPQTFVTEDEDSSGPRFVERKFGKCVPIAGIAGVQPGDGNRLILFLRDRRILSATLEKACRGRDYYSGFLIAKNSDGMLCTGRDELLSRSGVNCRVSGFKQLVEIDE